MSGLEALSLACNIFQTVAFARDTVNFCRDVYSGQQTPDSRLEAQATAMIQAAQQVEASLKSGKLTAMEQTLADVSRECIATAKKLQVMVQSITKMQQKGTFVSAFGARVKSLWRQKDIESLDKALLNYTNTMQVLLINRICNQDMAGHLKNQASFTQLDRTLQSFILQINAGHTKMEDLLRSEVTGTKAHVTKELQDVAQKDASRRQYERLLGSLRYPEMNERRNNITDPEDATFNRVFQSYERTAHGSGVGDEQPLDLDSSYPGVSVEDYQVELQKVDEAWKSFVDWLRSDHSLFWIQGKPGSGKSTLIKHIVANDATGQLLDEWIPGARILTHYFYLIGTSLQSNVTGMYSSLAHQLLQGDEALAEQVTLRLPDSISKHSLGDWSMIELKELLDFALDAQVKNSPLCIFIDGLDEYSGKDGQYGLLDRLSAIHQRPNVKLCVASRPEPKLLRRLQAQPNLKLHHLTWPDMDMYTRWKLAPLSEEGTISDILLAELTKELLDKAQGVFLWLVLALYSVKSGAENQDPAQLLLSRLQELPLELEDLYEAMWKRVNKDTSVYRESAATYLQIALLSNNLNIGRLFTSGTEYVANIFNPTLFETILAMMDVSEDNPANLDPETTTDFEVVAERYDEVAREIRVRCAGLLEIIPGGGVQSTAHDFLTTERAGRSILSYSKFSSENLLFSILRAWLSFVQLVHRQLGLQAQLPSSSIGTGDDALVSSDKVAQILDVTRRFYEKDILGFLPTYPMKIHFLSRLAWQNASDSWLHDQLELLQADAATVVLGDLHLWIYFSGWSAYHDDHLSLINVVRKLLSRGANPFALRQYHHGSEASAVSFNAIQILLFCIWDESTTKPDPDAMPSILEMLQTLLETRHAFTDHRWLLCTILGDHHPVPFGIDSWAQKSPPQGIDMYGCPIFEVSTSCLLEYGLAFAESLRAGAKQRMPRLEEVVIEKMSTTTPPCLRYVMLLNLQYTTSPVFYEIVSQDPFDGLMDCFFHLAEGGRMRQADALEVQAGIKKWDGFICSVRNDDAILKEISFEDITRQYGPYISSPSPDKSRIHTGSFTSAWLERSQPSSSSNIEEMS